MAKRKVRKVSKTARSSRKKTVSTNRKAHWSAYKSLQKKVDKAWAKLRSDVKRKASPSVLMRDRNQLLLLLGECNYMVRECTRCSHKRA